jgi:Leucine-rich repeat (LRR) protein
MINPIDIRIQKCIIEKNNILDLSSMNLSFLPDNIPDTITELYCYDNNLTIIDNLPKNIKKLLCCDNKINSINNNFPESLEYLCCDGNLIEKLPDNLKSINFVCCENNNITDISNIKINNNLKEFYCGINDIKYIPIQFSINNVEMGADNLQELYKLGKIIYIQRHIRNKRFLKKIRNCLIVNILNKYINEKYISFMITEYL